MTTTFAPARPAPAAAPAPTGSAPTVRPTWRHALLTQRAFRREQLDQLGRQRPARPLSGAHREIYVSLAVGARTALHEIESALQRMDEGRYGLCVTCGRAIDAQVLDALPQAARCLLCRRGAAPC